MRKHFQRRRGLPGPGPCRRPAGVLHKEDADHRQGQGSCPHGLLDFSGQDTGVRAQDTLPVVPASGETRCWEDQTHLHLRKYLDPFLLPLKCPLPKTRSWTFSHYPSITINILKRLLETHLCQAARPAPALTFAGNEGLGPSLECCLL